MTENRTYRSIGFLAVIFVLGIVGCGGNSRLKMNSEDFTGSQETATVTAKPSNMVSRVLEACSQEVQESVILPGEDIDWQALDINSCYHLWLKLLPGRRDFEGQANITFTNTFGDSLTELVFRLYPNAEWVYGGDLGVKETKIDGVLVSSEVFLADRTGLRLRLKDVLEPGETVVVVMEFQGQLNNGLGSSPKVYGIFNYSQDVDLATYANWYPILAEWEDGDWQAQPVSGIGDAVVSDAALYLVEISAPEELKIVTSGVKVNNSSLAGNEVSTFASGPIRDFFVVSGTTLSLTQAEIDGIQINHWGLPGGEGRSAEALQATIDSMEVFARRFGSYPYRELDVVSVPLQLASGVEYPGIFLMRDDLYLPNSEQPYLLPLIIAHESAHQWWYGLVGNDVLEHPWQDEALSTFTSLLYLEQFQPQVYTGTVTYFNKLSDDLGHAPDIDRAVSSFIDNPETYSPVVYSQGALFFVGLRGKIGDKDFFEAMRSYFEHNIYQVASPEDLLKEFSTACNCDLNDFFKYWGVKE